MGAFFVVAESCGNVCGRLDFLNAWRGLRDGQEFDSLVAYNFVPCDFTFSLPNFGNFVVFAVHYENAFDFPPNFGVHGCVRFVCLF